MSNTLIFQSADLPGSNNGGFGINFNLGPSTANLANQSFTFLNNANATNQGFVNQSIAGSQAFLAQQMQPLTSALSSASAGLGSASSALAGTMNAGASMANQISSMLPGITQWTGNQLSPSISNQVATTRETINPGNIWGFIQAGTSFQNMTAQLANQNYQQQLQNVVPLAWQISNNQTNVGLNSGGGCYITTAICEADGKPDDCEELQTFRKFRDSFMMATKARRSLVKLYYQTAPIIVEKIKQRADCDSILADLKSNYLMPCFEAVKRGDYQFALARYCAMIYYAARRVYGQ
jgi:hypothetical protein